MPLFRLTGESVLIVEDDHLVTMDIGPALERAGADVKAQPPLNRDGTARVPIGCSRRTVWMGLESRMENLTWDIVTIGVLVGGLIMIVGFRKNDPKPVAFSQIDGALKQDWMRTGNIDFYPSAVESPSPQPLRLRVEEKRVTESAAGQNVVELRWRLATLEEGKELVVCWNTRQT